MIPRQALQSYTDLTPGDLVVHQHHGIGRFVSMIRLPVDITSNATTAYYFDCTEHFEENLKILLSFVSVPHFTQESVDKERGIIGQEIRMVEDDPDNQVFYGLMECLFDHHPCLLYTSCWGPIWP